MGVEVDDSGNKHKPLQEVPAGGNLARISDRWAYVRAHVRRYAYADDAAAWRVVAITLIIYVGSLAAWTPMCTALAGRAWWWAAWVLSWIAVRACVLVRAYVLMHDFTHFAPFSSAKANKAVGYIMSAIVSMDFVAWKVDHNLHHNVLGAEEEHLADNGLTVFWTVEEWKSWRWGPRKAAARITRDPLLFFVLGGFSMLILNGVAPSPLVVSRVKAHGLAAYLSRWGNLHISLANLIRVIIMGRFMAPGFVAAELVSVLSALVIGLALFHLQHHFNPSYHRRPKDEHQRDLAALQGASFVLVPPCLRWMTLGIEYHHVHHLNAKVPCYLLQKCHEEAPPGMWEAAGVTTLDLRDCLRELLNVAWDADARRFVPFPEWAWMAKLLA